MNAKVRKSASLLFFQNAMQFTFLAFEATHESGYYKPKKSHFTHLPNGKREQNWENNAIIICIQSVACQNVATFFGCLHITQTINIEPEVKWLAFFVCVVVASWMRHAKYQAIHIFIMRTHKKIISTWP